MQNIDYWFSLKQKKRIVIKIGSSSLTTKDGNINYEKIEELANIISVLKEQKKEVILVSSGAVAVGRKELEITKKILTLPEKQACAATGQSLLMKIYGEKFKEKDLKSAQILLTKLGLNVDGCLKNIQNTIEALLQLEVIPIANENDSISTEEIVFGDNDTLSAVISVLSKSDLLIILTDTDGLYTEDPSKNKNAKLINLVTDEKPKLYKIATDTTSDVGTGGMYTKVKASEIVNNAGIDMVITNSNNMNNVLNIVNGIKTGTLFKGSKKMDFELKNYLK